MRVFELISGALVGIAAGVLGVIVHSGPVDQPWLGMLVAFVLVASGGWMVVETSAMRGWVGYAAATFLTTWLLLTNSPHNDHLIVDTTVSNLWFPIMCVALLVPLGTLLAGRRSAKNPDDSGESPNRR